MSKRLAAALTAAVLALAVVAAGCGGDDDEEAGGTTAGGDTAAGTAGGSTDCSASIAVMAPITGDAASIGGEQLNFAKFAVSQFNEEEGTDIRLVEGDTQLDPGQASTVAQRLVSDDAVVGVVGPAGSQEVEAVGGVFSDEDMAFISPSATRTSLTGGDYPSFFRVVPNDDAQGPTVAEFITEQLEAQTVAIVDDQTSYSTGLADSAASALQESDVEVQRESVTQEQSDFSSVVSTVADADVVFLPWQLANKAQVLAQQLKEQGSDATVVGSDGLFSEDFSSAGSYVSSFAPDIRSIDSSQELVDAYEAEYGEFTSTFGPPTYAATRVLLEAVQRACEGGAPERAAVLEEVRATDQSESILGQPIVFTEGGDVEGGRFFIFEVLGRGEYELQE